MPAVAQILIEVDDAGAVSSFKKIESAGGQIAPALAPVKPSLDNITKSSNEARESAALLGETLGTSIPRGLRNVISQSPAAATALKAAFSGLVIAGFIEFVKSAVDNLTGYSQALADIAKQNDAIVQSVASANTILKGPQTLKQVNADILSTTNQIAGLSKQLGLTGDALGDALTRGLTKYNAAAATELEALDQLKVHLNSAYQEQAKLLDEQKRTEPIAILQQENAAREAGLKGIVALKTADTDYARVVREQIGANVTQDAVGQAEIVAHHKQTLAQITEFEYQHAQASKALTAQNVAALLGADAAGAHGIEQIYAERTARIQQINAAENAANDALEHEGLARTADFQDQRVAASQTADARILELHRQVADEMAQADSEAALATVSPWERSYAQIQADTQNRLRQIQHDLDDTRISSTQAAQLAADAWQVNFARTRDQLAQDMEGFFDDLTSGNIGQRFKKMFEDLVFQMVATWILGMNSMRSAASTGFGGGPTGILGALLGIGGGSAVGGGQAGISGLPGVITNFAGGGYTSGDTGGALGSLPISIPGLGLSAGQGGGSGVVLPSGSATGGAASGIGGLLAKIFPNGLKIGNLSISGAALAAGGLALLTNGLGRGGVLGALESAGGGALTGFAIAGPIGAAVGALVGLFSSIIKGLFGPHKGDIARTQVMEPLLAQIKVITDSYDVFQTDYNTGVSELETLRTNALAALKKIGGNQVSGNSAATNQRIDAAEDHLKSTEAERQRRAQTDFGPPQFHGGGLVRWGPAAVGGRQQFHEGGEINANLLIGEGVLNRRAMNNIGVAGLNSLNSGGAVGVTHNHYYVSALDAKSVKQLFKRMQAEGAW